MALLQILQYPDPRLRIRAKQVSKFDDALRQMIEDMYATMYEYHGVGLAATQVNIHEQIFVMDVSETRDQPMCVINPEIISMEGSQYDRHGCLSVGVGGISVNDKINRAGNVKLRGKNIEGHSFELEAEGLMAICVQHEVDHLNGILFIDHFSRLKQERIRKKIEKNQRRT
jgi:peptide deformylase